LYNNGRLILVTMAYSL